MKRWGRVLSYVGLFLLVATQAPPAAASNTWSDTDPLVVVVTPAGNKVGVYVTNGVLGTEHLAAAQAALMAYTVKTVQAGRGTKVTLTVIVPDDVFGSGFDTRTRPSSGPLATGTLYGTAYGISGQAMIVEFTLPLP